MKKIFCSLAFFLFHACLCALIIESSTLKTIQNNVSDQEKASSIVVFDIDDTIARPKGQVGSNSWFISFINNLKQKGLGDNDSLETSILWYNMVMNYVDLLPIDDSSSRIKSLQERGFKVIGLTSRGCLIRERTCEQLKKIGIDFSQFSLCSKDLELVDTHKGFFCQGIIFCGQNNKGKLLFNFFEKIKFKPKKVIFIDDGLKYIQQVDAEAKKNNIEYIGIRFSGSDKNKSLFDAKKAAEEFSTIKRSIGFKVVA
jgi:hypothetical protein